MDISKNEVIAVQLVADDANKLATQTLNELELSLVGGGFGDVVFG